MAVSDEVRARITKGVNQPGDPEKLEARYRRRLEVLRASQANLEDVIAREETTKTHEKALKGVIEEYDAERDAIATRFPELGKEA